MPQDENKRVIVTEQTKERDPRCSTYMSLMPSLPRVRNVSKKGVVQKYYVQSGERVKPFP